MTYIIDANALLNITRELKGDAVDILENELTVTLASYEVGNAMWKECNLLDELDPEKASEILDFVGTMMEHMEVVSLREARLLEKTLQTAYEKKITYYDSAYLTIAEKRGEVLVTDDGDLRKVAIKADVETVSSAQMIEDVS